jgi:hypothetical protein
MSSNEKLPAGPWSRELVKEIAMDIGKEVVAHIEVMYPAAIAATPGTFKTSVQNTVYNQIMAALDVNDLPARSRPALRSASARGRS